MKKPWDYQEAGATALWNQVHNTPDRNPLVVMPTGSGKSLTMALWTMGMVLTYPHLRILNLTHVKELVDGNYKELLGIWPAAPAGIYSAGLKRKDKYAQITYAGIDSIRSVIHLFGHIDFVIVDEAHRISDNDKSSYQKVFAALRKVNPHLIVIGFTATDYRMGMGKLTEGGLFDDVCFDLSDGPAFVWMLDNYYLLRPVPKNPGVQVDAEHVKIKAGEYDEKSASDAFQDILEEAVDTIIREGVAQNRQAWMMFCSTGADCNLVADMFTYKGYPVAAVHSSMTGDRDEVLKAFRQGAYRGITNQNILTTGFNDPRIDLIGMLRLTRSPGLWVQMLGRGTRPLWTPGYDLSTFEGRRASILASPKQDCLVLDFAGNALRLGPINYPTLPKRKGSKGGDPPVRECPECNTYNHISLKCCEECGYEFPVQIKLKKEASAAELVFDLTKPLPPPPAKEYGVFPVQQMIAASHPGKNGKPPTMKVTYFAGVRSYNVYVCLEHEGFARTKALQWWKGHSAAGNGKPTPPPASVAEGLARFEELGKPFNIKVWLNTKYPEIEAFDFMNDRFELPPELGGPARVVEEAVVDRDDQVMREMQEEFGDEIPF